MHTWTTSTIDSHSAGEADTAGHAWQAAHQAAASIVLAGELETLTLEVDGQQATIRPSDTGDTATDVAATLEVIEAGRVDVVAAHQSTTDEATE